MDLRAKLYQVAPVTGRQFAAFRIALGAYLALHFARLMPWGAELFSRQGMVPAASLNPNSGILPNVLALSDSPAAITAFLSLLVVCSVLFGMGVARRTMAGVLWYGGACLFGRNVLSANAAMPYVGLLLLLTTLVPPTEPWRFRRSSAPAGEFYVPLMVWTAAWALMAAGYMFSGIVKLQSPSWVNGTAIWHLLNTPLARPGVWRDLVLSMPRGGMAGVTWSLVALDVLFLPLAVWRRTRPFIWGAMIAVHLGMMLLMTSADLNAAMLLLHGFTFDPRWIPRRRVQPAPLQNRWTPVQIG